MTTSCLLDCRTNLISKLSGQSENSESKDGATMNRATKIRSGRILFLPILLLATIGVQVRAQTPTPQNPVEPAQTQMQTQPNQANQLPDFTELNLSPDQIQKIRAINAELKDQRQAAGMKLRQAQRAMAEA